MTDKSCATCVKRHPVLTGRLECRARPPAPDVVYGRFPIVRDEDYCHSDFELDAEAAEARAAAQAETKRLDELVAATQAQAGTADGDPGAGEPKSTRARRARASAEPGPLL